MCRALKVNNIGKYQLCRCIMNRKCCVKFCTIFVFLESKFQLLGTTFPLNQSICRHSTSKYVFFGNHTKLCFLTNRKIELVLISSRIQRSLLLVITFRLKASFPRYLEKPQNRKKQKFIKFLKSNTIFISYLLGLFKNNSLRLHQKCTLVNNRFH